jgi:hypothetical protein
MYESSNGTHLGSVPIIQMAPFKVMHSQMEPVGSLYFNLMFNSSNMTTINLAHSVILQSIIENDLPDILFQKFEIFCCYFRTLDYKRNLTDEHQSDLERATRFEHFFS